MDKKISFIEEAAISLLEFQEKLASSYDTSSVHDRGDLKIGDEHWRYIRHGAGVHFIRYIDELSVDMEKDVHDSHKISAWRLALYLESKNLHFEESFLKDLLSRSKNFKEDGHFYKLKASCIPN